MIRRITIAAALVAWAPMSFLRVAGVFPSLAARGLPAMLEFAWAGAAAAIGIAAAWALWTRAPAATPLTRTAIAAAAFRELQRLLWTALPSDVIPGTRGWIGAAVVLVAAVLMAATARLDSAR